ncbi:phosphoribosylpyrophosphate synthetase [Mucilaginibacter sp. BJC16-A38]|uniref:phosphoribosylpyrophosphate synthetase n=1 Tax=Mucilaginibacter phenanthrenivorans TaxID=1234842 RepID=UPI0021575562|nr:phosphoribosylpyrophosphate synthetase [Mucilaginibacter phenanthrenivorans]MCR8561572.1 phosphoribosylpyrophosphate synthetase [Mucilaginibacter phenanthrenivorans]
MKQKFHYATVSEAIEQLKKQGYTLDLNLKENHFVAGEQQYPADEFEIVDLYRYEGASDPADEATVYALASASGAKGILVSGYGISTDDDSVDTLKQLHYKYQQSQS